MIKLAIQFDGLEYPIPVNPQDLSIDRSATNTNIDIVGKGKATRKGEPGLITMQIKSFFPSKNSRYYNGKTANAYIEFLDMIWQTENKNNKVAYIYSDGLKDSELATREIHMFFVIEKFSYKYVGGDFDTEYTLSIKEYRPYGVTETKNFSVGMQSARAPSTTKTNVPELMQDVQPTTQVKTYVISADDTLWSISKKLTGNGNNWKALYELNKDKIGTDPENIPVGITLTLPENWNSSKPGGKNTSTTTVAYSTGTKKEEETPKREEIINVSAMLSPKQVYDNLMRKLRTDANTIKQKQLQNQYHNGVIGALPAEVVGSNYLSELHSIEDRLNATLNNPNATTQQKSVALKSAVKLEEVLASKINKLDTLKNVSEYSRTVSK